MLTRAAADASKPEEIAAAFGLQKSGYKLTDVQAQAILDMRLARLTGLEQDKIVAEYKELIGQIGDLMDVLAKPARITAIIAEELKALKAQYGDKRKSEIVEQAEDLQMEDLIASEDVVVTFSHAGYIKSQPLTDYRAQRRGGRGKQAATTKEDDFIERLFIANTHDTMLCFSSRGRVYWLKVYNVPQGTRTSRGKPIVNLSPLSQFSNPREKGIIAVELDDGDHLIGGAITDGKHDVMLFSDAGKAVRFEEDDVRPMGRQARGVRGMKIAEGQKVISMLVADNEAQTVLTATENGFGKRTPISDYTRHGRGTQGMIAIQTSERNGKVIGAVLVGDEDEIMLISTGGVLIRTKVAQIREMGRSTQGVRLIDLDEGTKLAGVERVAEKEEEEGNGQENGQQ
jgi:DNA gyrase subunit A